MNDEHDVIDVIAKKVCVYDRPHKDVKPHEDVKTAFSKVFTLESVFECMRLGQLKTPFSCGSNT